MSKDAVLNNTRYLEIVKMASEVFLSDTRIKEGNEGLITAFHKRLEQKLHEKTRLTTTIFLDSDDITAGSKWEAVIKSELDKAKIFLFLLSPLGLKVHGV
jgi:hypothetical protein